MIDNNSYNYKVHDAHCCRKCGCKYGEPDCPVMTGIAPGVDKCEDCASAFDEALQAYFKLNEEEQWLFIREITGKNDDY